MKDKFLCHKLSEGVVEGEVLISQDDICYYLVDPETGNVIENGHDIEGQSVSQKIVVFPSGKGSSVVQADGLYQLLMKNNAPKAMVIKNPDTVLVTSGIIMEVPMVDKVEEQFYQRIKNGDIVRVDANNGEIIVVRN
ncbi:aconitase X swivel domain-containing protein [Sporomusa acidovorans]|uniref:Phosphomevalonate dehydratase small subunit-like domain-containing protein n=1 Tax=Sporomusa acidovorans (strain ATCC 49682 / DSM 3132 / Mol) TaxID=1123286 RepID=A0ABZ3JAZ1_SPOA4|nr:DUF126 domain-containing protein [Sporomusa acidovorans]OZC21619.1 hypothetical protein SPACI_16920 [Sporomusa acidovorans DSM 3132]SDD62383.1 predicted aconitase subunit 2 [Sporomusa acidovorans]